MAESEVHEASNRAIDALVKENLGLRQRLEALRPFLRHGINCPSRGMPADQVLHSCTCGLAFLAAREK